MIWKNALALQIDYGAGAGTASDDQLVSMRGLHELPAPVCLLSGKGYCKAEGSRAEEDFLGNAGGISGEHYNRAWYLPADVPFYPGRGAFGLLKNDFGFRRFLTRGKASIRTELFFLVLAYDFKKLWMKRENGRLKTHLSEITVA